MRSAANALGYNPRERSWNYLEPWMGGEWRLRDIVDYQLIALESCLYQAAIRRADLLRSFYRIGQRAVAQDGAVRIRDSCRATRSRDRRKRCWRHCSSAQVEIDRAGAPFRAGGKEYASGSYVIRMQQPYGSFAKTLLERQDYPDLRHVSRRPAAAAV